MILGTVLVVGGLAWLSMTMNNHGDKPTNTVSAKAASVDTTLPSGLTVQRSAESNESGGAVLTFTSPLRRLNCTDRFSKSSDL